LNRTDLATEFWSLQGSKARVASGSLAAELDVEQPMLGLTHLQWHGEQLAGSLMAVDVRDSGHPVQQRWLPADVYIRGGDLVATYREPAEEPFHLQVYWRALAPSDDSATTLEAIVSIQTPQWEAYPYITVGTSLVASQAQLLNGSVALHLDDNWSYIEASPPGDFVPSIHQPNSARWSYGKHFMERGVIRRLRLRGAFVPRARAENEIERHRSIFASEPPPLTA
jgi:hypothetical protein